MTQTTSRIRRALLAAGAVAASAALTHAQVHNGDVFLEEDGILAIQFESTGAVDGWELRNGTPGWTGEGYFFWNGPNLFHQPGQQGIFYFDFEVANPGTYTLFIRNRHENIDPTEENDVWVKMDGNDWKKIFSNMPSSVGNWTWESRVDEGSQPQMTYALSAGQHRIWFSGRSYGFKMDRVHLALPGQPNANNEQFPESRRRFGDAFCNAAPNSTGVPGRIEATGRRDHTANDLTLRAYDLPQNSAGVFLVCDALTSTPIQGGGLLCLAGPVGRYQANILNSGTTGDVELAIDLTQIPRATGFASTVTGDTWYFQYWHRDTGLASNFTQGVELLFD